MLLRGGSIRTINHNHNHTNGAGDGIALSLIRDKQLCNERSHGHETVMSVFPDNNISIHMKKCPKGETKDRATRLSRLLSFLSSIPTTFLAVSYAEENCTVASRRKGELMGGQNSGALRFNELRDHSRSSVENFLSLQQL